MRHCPAGPLLALSASRHNQMSPMGWCWLAPAPPVQWSSRPCGHLAAVRAQTHWDVFLRRDGLNCRKINIRKKKDIGKSMHTLMPQIHALHYWWALQALWPETCWFTPDFRKDFDNYYCQSALNPFRLSPKTTFLRMLFYLFYKVYFFYFIYLSILSVYLLTL